MKKENVEQGKGNQGCFLKRKREEEIDKEKERK